MHAGIGHMAGGTPPDMGPPNWTWDPLPPGIGTPPDMGPPQNWDPPRIGNKWRRWKLN